MSKIQDVPFITKVIDTLSDELKSGLYDLIDGQVKTPVFRSLVNNDYAITEANDKGKVQFVTLETLRGNYTGYLAYNSVYCVLIAFKGNTQALDMLNINVAKHTFAFVNESLSILELRVELEDGKEGVTPTDLGVTNNNIHLAKGTTQIGEGVNLKTLDGNTLIGSGNVEFKTINDQEIVGSGNIVVGEGGTITIDETTSTTSENALMNKTITNTFTTKTEVADEYAKQNGSYEDLNAGTADQLVSTKFVEDEVPYNYRTSGGDADIGNRVSERKIVGGTIGWNQLVQNGNFESASGWGYTSEYFSVSVEDNVYKVTVSTTYNDFAHLLIRDVGVNSGHKVLVCATMKSSVDGANFRFRYPFVASVDTLTTSYETYSAIGTSDDGRVSIQAYNFAVDTEYYIKNVQLFDLTAMFGSTIADYIYNLEQGTTGDGVAWFKKMFPKNYYAYNAGTLLSTKASMKTTIGFNQWDEEWELGNIDEDGQLVASTDSIRSKNRIRVIPGVTYYIKSPLPLFIWGYDSDGNYLGRIPTSAGFQNSTITINNSNCHYISFVAYITTYNNDICINLSWSGWRNGEYEPYEKHEYALPNIVLRGIPKLDSSNNLYFDGDYTLPSGETHRRFGVVDLGTLNWYKSESNSRFQSDEIADIVNLVYPNRTSNIICSKYATTTIDNISEDKKVLINQKYVVIFDSDYDNAVAFKTAMSGVYLIYELAEETTETTDTYQELQIVNDFGTEEFTCVGYDESTATATAISIPCGHDSDYYNNLRDKLQRLPEMPTVSDSQTNGVYVVEYSADTKQCTFTELATWLATNGYAVNVIPTAPTTQGTYNLQVSVDENGTPTYSWVSNA